MLTEEDLRKALEQADEQTKNLKYYLFMSNELGEEYGLKDGQIINKGSVQIVFNERIRVV